MRVSSRIDYKPNSSFSEGPKFKTNNLVRKIEGIEVGRVVEGIRLRPIGPKGPIQATFLDIPLNEVDIVIEALKEIKKMQP